MHARIYPYGYYPHNVHFELVSAQMAGDAGTSLEASDKLAGLIPDEVAATVGLVQPVKAAPYFAYAQFAEPAKALALPDPGDGFPYLQAMWHYARGAALVAQGDLDGARTEAAPDRGAQPEGRLQPAAGVGRAGTRPAAARPARAGGPDRAGRRRPRAGDPGIRVAVQIQDSIPYMEPPYWYYPVRQSLGAALLMAGRADEAAQVFQAALLDGAQQRLGAVRAHEGRGGGGDAAGAAATRKLFEQAWAGDRERLELARL